MSCSLLSEDHRMSYRRGSCPVLVRLAAVACVPPPPSVPPALQPSTDKPLIVPGPPAGSATKQATFGGGIDRNMVNLVDKSPPTDWNAEEGKFKNIKWT